MVHHRSRHGGLHLRQILDHTAMIFLQLFITFSKIGIFNFGGGYAMISLIQDEVVNKHHWLTTTEFTDIIAISQSTPGPIGINAATYTGYTAVINAGYPEWAAVLSAVMTSLSIMWLPFILMISISKYLIRHKDSLAVANIFTMLRPTVLGLILAAAIMLMNVENFGSPTDSTFEFIVSCTIFILSFVGTRMYKVHPILMILLCGLAGLIIY